MTFREFKAAYNDPNHPVALGGRSLIKQYFPNLAPRQVKAYLAGHRLYTTYKPWPKRRKATLYNPIYTHYSHYLYEADILYLDARLFPPEANEDCKYILCCICTFSKFAYTYALKRISAKTVLACLEEWWRSVKRLLRPTRSVKIRTDHGVEFTNHLVQDFFAATPRLRHYFSNTKRKCAIVERFNRTLQDRLVKVAGLRQTQRIVRHLNAITDTYNNTKTRVLGWRTPEYARRFENEEEIRGVHARRYAQIKKRKASLAVGDIVRVAKTKTKMSRSYHTKYSSQLFKVTQRFLNLKRARYEIAPNFPHANPLVRRFDSVELLRVEPE